MNMKDIQKSHSTKDLIHVTSDLMGERLRQGEYCKKNG